MRTLAGLAVAMIIRQLHSRPSRQRQSAGGRSHQIAVVVRATILVQRSLLHLNPARTAEIDAVDLAIAPSYGRQLAAAVAADEQLAGRAAVARQEGIHGLASAGIRGDLYGRIFFLSLYSFRYVLQFFFCYFLCHV